MADRVTTEPGIFLGAQQLTALLDAAQEFVAVLGRDGNIQFATETFRNLLGYGPEELAGRSILGVVHSTDAGHMRERLKEVISQAGSRVSERCRFRCRDGSWRWVQVTLRNRLGDAAVEGILLHGSDVTELHRMESERQVISDVVHALNQTSNLDQ